MSANGKFWANVRMLQSPQLQLYLSHSEKDEVDKAEDAASNINVLENINSVDSKRVEELLCIAIERRDARQKNYDTYRRAS